MLYLKRKDAEILLNIMEMLTTLENQGKLTEEQVFMAEQFRDMCVESALYTRRCRQEAKEKVQAKRKIDKTYAHKRKKEK